jgi:XTP/dITP diphosphohydrolase
VKQLLLGTGNPFKARELQAMMGSIPLVVRTLADYPELAEVEEDKDSLEGNARKKAEAYARGSGLWALADDTGLEVDALGGAPGVYTARYAGANADFDANNKKLLKELHGVPAAKRTAVFRCVLALSSPAGQVTLEEGLVRGRIADSYQGEKGFGYDPIFFVPKYRKTLGEMDFDEKARHSHRAEAMARMLPHLEKLAAGTEGRARPTEAKSCPRCGLELDAWHCRMICPGCGYQEDCSDVALP